VASEIAVNTISQGVAESDGRHILDTLRLSIQQASQEIYQQAQESQEKHGMGATCAAACVIGHRLYTATVGDSRIYLLRGQNIRQISTDHTWIQEALDAGIMTADQVEGHPNAHVIRRYLGSPNPPDVDLRLTLNAGEGREEALANQGMPLLNEDRLLLCSDGLSDLVKPEEILNVCQHYPLEQIPQALIDLANARGGHDNITVIILQMTEAFAPRARFARKKTAKSWRPLAVSLVAAVGLAVILGALVGGWLLLRDRQNGSPSATPGVQETLLHTVTEESGTLVPEVLMPTSAEGQPQPVLPAELDDGATMTPWPTHTLQATATLPVVPTLTPVP
jgi:protein phosphatase